MEISDSFSKKINFLKAICTILVIFIHADMEMGIKRNGVIEPALVIIFIISQNLSRVAVPMFFFLSAVLLYRKRFIWRENMKRVFKTIGIPYMFWNSFWIMAFYIGQKIVVLSRFFTNENNIISQWGVLDWLRAYTGFFYTQPFYFPFWFMEWLFIMNVFSVCLKRLIDKWPKICFAFLTVFWILGNTSSMYLQSVVWFSAGYYYVSFPKVRKKIEETNIWIWTIILTILIFCNMMAGESLYFIKRCVVGIEVLILFKMADILFEKMKDFTNYILPYSLFIYGFHGMLIIFVEKGIGMISIFSDSVIVTYVGGIIATLCISLLLARFTKRMLPGIYRLSTGFR